MLEQQTPQQTDQIEQTDASKELRLEDLLKSDSDTNGLSYVITFTQEAIMDSSPEIRAFAIRNLRDIGEHLPGKPKILGGYERFRKLYLRIKTTERIQEVYVSEVPSKYEAESSTGFTINGNNLSSNQKS